MFLEGGRSMLKQHNKTTVHMRLIVAKQAVGRATSVRL
jgi:hypothetical protein